MSPPEFEYYGVNLIPFKECTVVGDPKNKIVMLERRLEAGAVVLNQSTLWVVGGWNGKNDLSTTEFLNLDQKSVYGIATQNLFAGNIGYLGFLKFLTSQIVFARS